MTRSVDDLLRDARKFQHMSSLQAEDASWAMSSLCGDLADALEALQRERAIGESYLRHIKGEHDIAVETVERLREERDHTKSAAQDTAKSAEQAIEALQLENGRLFLEAERLRRVVEWYADEHHWQAIHAEEQCTLAIADSGERARAALDAEVAEEIDGKGREEPVTANTLSGEPACRKK